ncbi:MAG: ribonuclease HII [bacterium]|nr:ribonuclease HII [bacterium]
MANQAKWLKTKKSTVFPLRTEDLLVFEKRLYAQGFRLLAGLDEVGRGCLAGPVVAAAVIFPRLRRGLSFINDSKKLTPLQREKAYKEITQRAITWGIGFVGAEEIDRINIFQASKKAMLLALKQLSVKPDHLLIDGNFGIDSEVSQTSIIQGDARSISIAAASIMAKVTRDRWIAETGKEYPRFSFAKHKGYGTPEHLKEISLHGLTDLHRRSFSPCQQYQLL